MEKQLNKQIDAYLIKFKDDIRSKVNEINFDEKQKINELIEYVYEYARLHLDKEDIIKRKRVKNAIPNANRCIGKLANDERCTRRRKKDSDFCGTHIKGTPNGCIQLNETGECNLKSIEVSAKEYSGIVYYVDQNNRVYKTEDVLAEKQNPAIIGQVVERNGIDFVELV
jgi:hypothetical protein